MRFAYDASNCARAPHRHERVNNFNDARLNIEGAQFQSSQPPSKSTRRRFRTTSTHPNSFSPKFTFARILFGHTVAANAQIHHERKLRILTLHPPFHSIYFFVPFCIFGATTIIPFISVYFFPIHIRYLYAFFPDTTPGRCVSMRDYFCGRTQAAHFFYFIFVLFYFCRVVRSVEPFHPPPPLSAFFHARDFSVVIGPFARGTARIKK